MNIITFALRSILALWIGKKSIDVFAQGHLIWALACLSIALVMAWPPLQFIYSKKKLTPIDLLNKKLNDPAELLTMLRILLGLILAVGGSNAIGRGEVLNGCGAVLVGLFLVAPLSKKVFDYPQPIMGLPVRWGKRMTTLVVLRSIGIFLILGVLISLTDTDGKIPKLLIIPGLVLLFIRRIIPSFFQTQQSAQS